MFSSAKRGPSLPGLGRVSSSEALDILQPPDVNTYTYKYVFPQNEPRKLYQQRAGKKGQIEVAICFHRINIGIREIYREIGIITILRSMNPYIREREATGKGRELF